MKKTYQPSIIEKANELVETLVSIEFFKDYFITDYEPAREIFAEELTKKFISGSLDEPVFTDVEWVEIMKIIVATDTLNSLKEKGLITSYSDDSTEEVFFLTEKGKEIGQQIVNNIDEIIPE